MKKNGVLLKKNLFFLLKKANLTNECFCIKAGSDYFVIMKGLYYGRKYE